VELADRCRELGAPLWGITDDPVLADRLDGAVRLPEGVAEPLGPILAAPVLQWWALEAARARRVDPDHPAAIAKVTRTR
jgi:fructoselysine-6-P-deglycase FrlB-like protein